MAHTFVFSCPLCEPAIGYFERKTELGLSVAVAAHIMGHMDSASLKAVNDARMHCTEITCALGKSKVYDGSAGLFAPKLTEYDRKMLSGMKIKID